MTSTLRAQAAAAARDYDAVHMNHFPEMPHYARVMFVEGYLLGHAAGVEEGARDVSRQAHDAMERAIGRARKAKEIARTARLRCEMSAVVGWIAALQEEMFINPETRILSSLAPGTAIIEDTDVPVLIRGDNLK